VAVVEVFSLLKSDNTPHIKKATAMSGFFKNYK